jgi:hypothetical protein
VEGVVFKYQFGALGVGQAVLREGQIAVFVAAVELVANNRVTQVCEVDADLVFASGVRDDADKREWKMEGGGQIAARGGSATGNLARPPWHVAEDSLFNKKFGLGGGAIGTDAIFHGHDAVFIFSQGRVDEAVLLADVAMHYGKIFFLNEAVFQGFAERAGGLRIFRDQNHAAGFAVEAVDQIRLEAWGLSAGGQMQTGAADEAGRLAVLGGMTDQAGGFVDREQVGIFKNDLKKLFHNLSLDEAGVSFALLKEKLHKLLPALFIAVLAVSRIPGLLPANFSVVYAFVFCAGVYFPKRIAWWLPLGTMLATDVALNIFYYHVPPFGFYLLLNYAVYAVLIALGKWFGARAGFFKLLFGGLLGAVLFYLVTNTLAWFQDPDYAKTIAGWIQALTVGLPNIHPSTWELFRNTFLSTGLFTTLFVASEKLSAPSESPADKRAGASDENETETEPEEAEA